MCPFAFGVAARRGALIRGMARLMQNIVMMMFIAFLRGAAKGTLFAPTKNEEKPESNDNVTNSKSPKNIKN